MNSCYRTLGDQTTKVLPLSPICRNKMNNFDDDLELSGSKCSTRLETSKRLFSSKSILNSTDKSSSKGGCRCNGTSFRTALKILNIPPSTPKSSTICSTALSGNTKSVSSLRSISSPISTSSPINYKNSASHDSNTMSSSKGSSNCSRNKTSENSNKSSYITSTGNGTKSFSCGSQSSFSSSRKSSVTNDSSSSKISMISFKTRESTIRSFKNNNSNSSSGNNLIQKTSFVCGQTSTGYNTNLSSSSSSCSKTNNSTSRKSISGSKSPCTKSSCSKMNSFRSKLYATCQSSNGLSFCASIVSTAINATINSTARSNETTSSFESERNSSVKPVGSLFTALLDNAGLGKYKIVFEKENIDALSFTLLQAKDFERLGIRDPDDLRRIVGLIQIIIQFFIQRSKQSN